MIAGPLASAVFAFRHARERTRTVDRPPHNDDAAKRPRLRILHLIVSLGSTNTEYNEHCLPMRHERAITVCSFTPAAVDVPEDIELFEGNGTYVGYWRALRRALRAHPYDVVHVHAPRTAGMLLLASASVGRSMKDTVATLHNSWENFKPLARPMLFVIAATFAATVSCGRSASETLPSALKRTAGRRFHVIQNGTDTERVAAALGSMSREREDRPGRFTVTWVGRMLPRKDPLTMLDAAELLPDNVDVVFVGDGEELPRLQREVARRQVGGRVRLAGLVEREEVYREIARSDVFVSTSTGEGLPVAVLEAMACGTPVVLSDIAPHREIEDAEIPFVPVGDAAGFAAEIERMLALPPEELVALGRLGKEVVERRFSLTAMQRRYGEVYERLRARV